MNQQKLETITLLAEAAVSVANALNKLVDYTTAQGIDPSIMQAPMSSNKLADYTSAQGIDPSIMQAPMSSQVCVKAETIRVTPEGIDNSADGETAAASTTESVAATKKPATRKPAASKKADEEPQPDPKPVEKPKAEAEDLLTIGDTASEDEKADNVAETKESVAETKESNAEATGVTLASITAALSRAISAGSIVKTDVKTWLEDFDVKALSDLDAEQRDAFYNKHSDILGELK